MDIKKLQALVIEALEDVKAQDINIYDTTHLTSLFDRVAIASGTSNRQTKALAASVRDKVKENGGRVLSVEGETTGEWVLVDLGDMIVHIMQPTIRAYYRLEEIWGDKEVKFGAAKRISKRTASEPMEEDAAPKKASRHLTTDQSASEAAPKKTSTRKAPATKAVAKKRVAKTPVGKTVKVTASKNTTTSPKKAASKTASSAPKRAPVKRAVKAKTAE